MTHCLAKYIAYKSTSKKPIAEGLKRGGVANQKHSKIMDKLSSVAIDDAREKANDSDSFCEFLDKVPKKLFPTWNIILSPDFKFYQHQDDLLKLFELKYENWLYFALTQYVGLKLRDIRKDHPMSPATKIEVLVFKDLLHKIEPDIITPKYGHSLASVKLKAGDYVINNDDLFKLTSAGREHILVFNTLEFKSMMRCLQKILTIDLTIEHKTLMFLNKKKDFQLTVEKDDHIAHIPKLAETITFDNLSYSFSSSTPLDFLTRCDLTSLPDTPKYNFLKAYARHVNGLPRPLLPPHVSPIQILKKILKKIMSGITLSPATRVQGPYDLYGPKTAIITEALQTVEANMDLLRVALWKTPLVYGENEEIPMPYIYIFDRVLMAIKDRLESKELTTKMIPTLTILLGVITHQFLLSLHINEKIQAAPNEKWSVLIFNLTCFLQQTDTLLASISQKRGGVIAKFKSIYMIADKVLKAALSDNLLLYARRPLDPSLIFRNEDLNYGLHRLLLDELPVTYFRQVLRFDINQYKNFGFSKDLFELSLSNSKGKSVLNLMCSQTPRGGIKGDYLSTYITYLDEQEKKNSKRTSIPAKLYGFLESKVANQKYATFLVDLLIQKLPAALVVDVFRTQGFGDYEFGLDTKSRADCATLLGVFYAKQLLMSEIYSNLALELYLTNIDIDFLQQVDQEGHSIEWHIINDKVVGDIRIERLMIIGRRLLLSDQSLIILTDGVLQPREPLSWKNTYRQDHLYNDKTTSLLNAVQTKASFVKWRERRDKLLQDVYNTPLKQICFNVSIGELLSGATQDNALHIYLKKLEFSEIDLKDIAFLIDTCGVNPTQSNKKSLYPMECFLDRLKKQEGNLKRESMFLQLLPLKFPDNKFVSLAYKRLNEKIFKKHLGKDYLSAITE